MKFIGTLFLTLIASCSIYSQVDYGEGFVVTNQKDTVKGLVQYLEGGKAAVHCNFKASVDAPMIKYLPGQILGYGYKDERYYESKKIKIEQDSSMHFVEVAVKGLVSFYVFKDRFWIDRNGQNFVELRNDLIEGNLNGVAVVRKSNQYIATLNMILGDCSSLREEIQIAKFHEKSLTRVVDMYNKCSNGSSVIFKDNRKKFRMNAGVSGGIQSSEINFDTSFDYLQGEFESPQLPFVGASFDFYLPRISERFSISSALFYAQSNYYHFSETNRVGDVNKDYVSIHLKQLKVPFGIKYEFSRRRTTPYITIGATHILHLKSKAEWIDETVSILYTPYRVTSTVGEALPIRSSQWGFYGGIGLTTPINKNLKASLELRGERTNSIVDQSYEFADQNYIYSGITNFQIIFSIRTK